MAKSRLDNLGDAYDELERLYFEDGVGATSASIDVANKYDLTVSARIRILGWLNDEIATQAGDAAAQERLDEDH